LYSTDSSINQVTEVEKKCTAKE